MRKPMKYWTEEKLHAELLAICAGSGVFPSSHELQNLGRGDLSNQIAKKGGFFHWAHRLGFRRKKSDSDKGWEGEDECLKILTGFGFTATKAERLRSPYDILVEQCVRVDVKTARYAEYGPCRGWFYRVGKIQTSDLLMLFQADTKESYYLPWTVCPETNITIARDGGKYKSFRNNVDVLREMVAIRSKELSKHSALVMRKTLE